MALYFLSIILTTLVTVTLLFFFTVGRPLARDIHAQLRNHTHYLASLVRDVTRGPELVRAFDRFSDHYGFDIALFDHNRHKIVSSSSIKDQKIELRDTMFDRMNEQGIFVQSSHFGRPLIYMLPVVQGSVPLEYLYITKRFPETGNSITFLSGLALIGILLTLAVYPLSKSITRPLTQLTRDLEKIAAGQFNEVPNSVRKDEVGELIRGLRAMSQSVNRMIQSKKQLLADISHELCSPLARIRVGTELIKDATVNEKSKRYLENIDNDIASMDHLIGNLSAFSRMNLPGFALNITVITPHDLVKDIRAVYLPSADMQQINLDIRITGVFSTFTGDYERLKQVFSNLMDNAFHYSHPNESIFIGAEETHDSICFFVEDQGPGVPDTDAEKIFEPFYRVDFSRNRDLGGTGLGLAISRKIMELHGGKLIYSRTRGRTRFTFNLKKSMTPEKQITKERNHHDET